MTEAELRSPPGMVLVPAGAFLFGREKREASLGAFWIDRDPVTNREYDEFVAKTGAARPAGWPRGPLPDTIAAHPVVHVSFEAASAYAAFVGKALPTPGQWEKAARGRDGRKFPWGNDFNPNRTNTKEAGLGRTIPVGALRDESPFGCRGMSGNVLQWTRGVYDARRGTRVLRGGSFRNYLGAVAWDYEGKPDEASDAIGFRCVLMAAASAPPRSAGPGGPG